MKISHRMENDICIVTIAGNLLLSDTTPFRTYISSLMNEEDLKAFVLDTNEIERIDSAGLGTLAALEKQTGQEQLAFGICQKTGGYLFEAMKLTNLLDIFIIYESQKDALTNLA
ncbi:MAG: STAS domain-containing protein [SAR324 cluster bacterium]|nr:STAS domain-containing protein [SAR324 cluster bacterium]